MVEDERLQKGLHERLQMRWNVSSPQRCWHLKPQAVAVRAKNSWHSRLRITVIKEAAFAAEEPVSHPVSLSSQGFPYISVL